VNISAALCRRIPNLAPEFHHERWDGSGYPAGLAAAEIPEIARLVAVVDVFDALYNERTYKPAWPLRRCLDYIGSHAGTQFDPGFAALFISMASDLPHDWQLQALRTRAT
jgi:putative two-component system response regulator